MTVTLSSKPQSSANDVNSLEFFVRRFANRLWTSTLVTVVSVTNTGGLSPVGEVSIRPMVGMIDGDGNVHPHGDIHDVPYSRLQGGEDAIILDPKVGDIGIALFASRDISAVKKTKKESPPGSDRKQHISDALYIGWVLNGTPTQYVRFSTDGIELVSPTKITLNAPIVEANAPNIVLNGAVNQGNGSNAGNASFGGDITAFGEITGKGIALAEHKHSGVQSGSSETGVPVV